MMKEVPLDLLKPIISSLLKIKAELESEKFTSLQDYFSNDKQSDLCAKEVGVKLPVMTEEGLSYQTQFIPLFAICPCHFFKLDALSLQFDAYMKLNHQKEPQLILDQKSGWLNHHPLVRISISMSEGEGAKVDICSLGTTQSTK